MNLPRLFNPSPIPNLPTMPVPLHVLPNTKYRELPEGFTFLDLSSDLIEIPVARIDGHKYHKGHVLVIAGSEEMPGAGLLASHSAMRSGAGAVSKITFGSTDSGMPEVMHIKASNGLDTTLLSNILSMLDKYSSILIGPGLGRGDSVNSFVLNILKYVEKNNTPCIIDADGLNALAELHRDGQKFNLKSAILTPHEGEAAKLLQLKSSDINSNRFQSVKQIIDQYKATVLLKGPGTICSDGSRGAVNTSGGPYLATAGSGDVLAGLIASLIGTGIEPLKAASTGAYIHGVAGDWAWRLQNKGPIVASDIITNIPLVVGELQNTRNPPVS